MKRLHLFEFEDQPWLPAFLRSGITDYLASVYRTTNLPATWAGIIGKTIEGTGSTAIVDIGSGSAGPMPIVLKELRRLGHSPGVTLTDLYPRAIRAADCDYDYWPEPLDARHVPNELPGVRTMFAALHHFTPEQARAVLASAASDRVPICIFEGTSRSVPAIASSLLIPLFVWLMTPTIRPVTLTRILFTHVVPVLPLLIWWDGLVSHLRTYSSQELLSMADAFRTPDYRWTAGEVSLSGLPIGLRYLVGMPLGGRQRAISHETHDCQHTFGAVGR